MGMWLCALICLMKCYNFPEHCFDHFVAQAVDQRIQSGSHQSVHNGHCSVFLL